MRCSQVIDGEPWSAITLLHDNTEVRPMRNSPNVMSTVATRSVLVLMRDR